MKFDGGALEVLAEAVDQSRPVYLAAQVHRVWTEAPVSGFTFEESRALDMEDGWRLLQWPKGLDSLAGTTGCIKLKFRNLKIWAVRGDICSDGHRLWEGADMENEGS